MNLSIILKNANKSIVLVIPASEEQKLFDIIALINKYQEYIDCNNHNLLANKISNELNIPVQFLPILAEITL